ncbi:GL19057, partial [Drosophila persimilis]
YFRNNNQKIIFEDNHRNLESATAKISECLEREITAPKSAEHPPEGHWICRTTASGGAPSC